MTASDYRKDFPLLQNEDTIYIDNAATAQRPQAVLDAVKVFYETENANPLRGFYPLSLKATESCENARATVRDFIHATSKKEIIFTRNTTEGLNLVAYSYGLSHLKAGDEIAVTIMEHHSNLLPWQMVSRQTGAELKFMECEPDGSFTEEKICDAVTPHTKLAALTLVSNVLGRATPAEKLIGMVHENGGVVLADAAQAAPHMPIDVTALDVDFLAFSGHKLMAPMGIGVLYGKQELLEEMPPFLTGGEMIDRVTRERAVFAGLPHKFEAGTVNAGGAVALAAAIDYLESVGWKEITEREEMLTAQLLAGMKKIPGVHILGSGDEKEHCGIVSFTVDDVHPHDIASILDEAHVAVRAGHHCAQPLLEWLGISSCARASVAFYNTPEDVGRFLDQLAQVRRMMGYE